MKRNLIRTTLMILSAVFFSILSSTSPVSAQALTTCGTISAAGTYNLQNDVSSNGTCFSVTAPNVILDLNGHTVTYDSQAPVTVANGSFEYALAGTWDMTNAANAARITGTFVKPVQVYEGSYAIRWTLPTTNQYFESANPVTLAANTSYSLSLMVYNNQYNDAAVSIEVAGTAYKATTTGKTERGYQYTNIVFTTGGSQVSGKLRVSISNAGSGSGYVYVDDVRILKTGSYGVHAGPNYANANSLTITNGTIIQGQGNGFESHAIKMEENAGTGFSIDHLNLTTQGVNSKIIQGYYLKDSTINNNTINHNVQTIQWRDHLDGAAIKIEYNNGAYGSSIHDNIFTSGIQNAIVLDSDTSRPRSTIYNNNITMQTKYTNDFAILAGGSEIHHNTINCGTGNNSCRGISVSSVNTLTHDNIITVQQLERNQEYDGCEAWGAYGLQGEYMSDGAEVYGNTVTAYATGACDAAALRLNPDAGERANIYIHDNTFTAIANGTGKAKALYLSNSAITETRVENNTFKTNRYWVYVDQADNQTPFEASYLNNRWETTGTVDSPFRPFFTDTTSIHLAVTGNAYGAGDQARFESEYFRTANGARDNGCSIIISGTSGPDSSAPAVSLTAPSNNSTVSGTASLTANASDNVGVTKVEFYVNNVLQGSDTASPYSFNWNTTAVANGVYSITAKAYDAANNVTTSSAVNVTVSNAAPDTIAPTISITAPANNATVNGTVSVSASASDAVGVSRVDFYINGALRASVNTPPYSFNWNTTAEANASYTLTGKAYDAAGNVGTSSGKTVTVNNPVSDTTAPVVNTFTMTATATSLTVAVSSFTASDAAGVTGYLITESSTKPAANAAGWGASAPASFTFSAAGSKTAYAWAKDAAGNVSASRSAAVVITLPDTTAPVVSAFTMPATATSLAVTVSSFTASDATGVTGYLITESATKPAANATGWSASVPASFTFSASGSKTAYAWARDTAGNVSSSRSASVVLSLPDTTAPSISFTSPTGGTTLSGSVAITATATDNVGITKVELYINGVLTKTDSASPFSFTWNTPTLANGSYTLVAKAYDAAGNSAVSELTVTVYNPSSYRNKKRGDLNGDGKIDITDALLALKRSVGLAPQTIYSQAVTATAEDGLDGDVAPLDGSGTPQGDGVVDVADAILLLRNAVGAVSW